jgi:hypothetical protein
LTTKILFEDGSEIDSADLTPGQQLLVDDGLPVEAIIPPADRKEAWKGKKLTKPQAMKPPAKDEDPATKALRKEMAAAEEKKKAERFARLKQLKQETAVKKISKKTPAPKAKASGKAPKKATKASAAKEPHSDGVRPGSKLEVIVGLLTRPEGCTTAEILAATDWPSVSVPQQAKAANLKLRKEKDGKASRYWGAAA